MVRFEFNKRLFKYFILAGFIIFIFRELPFYDIGYNIRFHTLTFIGSMLGDLFFFALFSLVFMFTLREKRKHE